jgi:hypothetical protein
MPATPTVGAPPDPIVAAATAAGLTPFPAEPDARASDLLKLGSDPTAPLGLGPKPLTASTAAAIAAATPVPAQPAHGGGGQEPQPPGGPPGNAGAGGVASGAGGVASGGWCAVLFVADPLAPPELRPHRCRLVLAAQAGATSLLHRPG